MEKPGPKPLEKILEKFFREQGQEQSFKEIKVFQIWRQAVGEEISKNAIPISVNQGRLLVAVRNSIWLNELGFARQKLKSKLNRALGKNIIKEISFRISELPEQKPIQLNPEPKEKSPELLKKLEQLLATIDDQNLKQLLKNWLSKSI